MVSIVHYEVYLFHNGRWELHGRYASSQKQQALDDAKYTEASLSCPSKVIRELYETTTGEVEEVVIYISEKIRTGQHHGAYGSDVSSGSSLWDNLRQKNREKQNENKKLSPTVDAGIKFISVIGISILIAIFLAVVITLLTSYLSHKGSIAPTNPARIFVAIFVAVFIFTSVPLASVFVPWQAFEQDDNNKNKNKNFENNKQSSGSYLLNDNNNRSGLNIFASFVLWLLGIKDNQEAPEKKDDDEKEKKLESYNKKLEVEGNPLKKEAEKEEQKLQEEQEKNNQEQLEKNKAKEAEAEEKSKPIKEKQPAKKEPVKDVVKEEIKEVVKDEVQENEPEAEIEQKTAKKEDVYDEELEKARTVVMKFLGGVVSVFKTKYKQIDAYNKFGMNLILAGAVENLKKQNGLTDKNYNILICETIEFMGTNASLAQAFCSKLEEYSIEPSYLVMIRSGNEAMERMQKKLPEPFKVVLEALNGWNNPDSINESKPVGIMTIMFTDMVNSTASTQDLGDEEAQELIRVHNRIVRGVLSDFDGKEVKHTGDGIMASFSSSSNALEASIRIQQLFAQHNIENPDKAVRIRIGINAGEPIVEDDDLFGTTVQVAARVCDFANPDQILVTNVVKELSAGKVKHFYNLGPSNLKGIKEAVLLYEIAWQKEKIDDTFELNEAQPQTENDLKEENAVVNGEVIEAAIEAVDESE